MSCDLNLNNAAAAALQNSPAQLDAFNPSSVELSLFFTATVRAWHLFVSSEMDKGSTPVVLAQVQIGRVIAE